MENGYDRNAWYKFTDKDGNTYVSRGDNGYVQQSVTGGIPISIDANGNWYTEPFLELTKTGYVGHIPDWFKGTDEYKQWQTYTSQIPNLPVTKDSFTNLSSILKALGSQGAVRQSLIGDISKLGVVDKDLQRKFVNDIVAAVTEGKTGTAAKLNDIFGSNKDESVADIARSFKDMSKEELSSMITKLQYMASASGEKNWTGSKEQQKQVLDAATTLKILNYVDDNYQQYGKDNEFKGLLEASLWQKFQRGVATASATFTESSIFGLPVRVAYGISNAAKGGDFSLQIEDSVNKQLSTNSSFGANLEGLEASEAIGMWGGALTNIAASIITMRGVGNFLSSSALANTSFAGLINTMNNSGIVGAIAYDFFLNDLPLDMVMFINDVGRYNGDVVKAFWNPEDPQPLTGIPFVRYNDDTGFWMPSGLGPDVAGGLVMNVVGDLIVDCAPWLVKVANNSITKQMDGITNGGFTRLRENIAVQNLKLQQKFTEIPVVGTAWQKFIDGMMGAQKANLIREARKAAIAENSMSPYVRMQNVLTLANHKGMTEIEPIYRALDQQYKVSDTAKMFIKNGDKYGGFSEVKTEWKEIANGQSKTFYKVVPDMLPKQVKQGLLDVERLSELQGEIKNEGGLVANPMRNKEIAEIEERLSKTPQEIKDFADQFSQLNKAVEYMGVKLGVTNEEWVDALNADPRWAQYMTRQSLTPGYASILKDRDPTAAKILSEKRKGYYAQNYIDPMWALSMKVEALGNAYAWNEIAKVLVSTEAAQGKIIAGKGGIETAKRLEEIRAQIKQGFALRDKIGYDDTLERLSSDANTIGDAFSRINELLHLPEKLSLKSVYDAMQNPSIRDFISDFEAGKIKFADGAKESANLSDSDAAIIIKNTYAYNGTKTADRLKTTTEKAKEVLYANGIKGGDVIKWLADDMVGSTEKIEGLPELTKSLLKDEMDEMMTRIRLYTDGSEAKPELALAKIYERVKKSTSEIPLQKALNEMYVKEKQGDTAAASAIKKAYEESKEYLPLSGKEVMSALEKLGYPRNGMGPYLLFASEDALQTRIDSLPKNTKEYFLSEYEAVVGKKEVTSGGLGTFSLKRRDDFWNMMDQMVVWEKNGYEARAKSALEAFNKKPETFLWGAINNLASEGNLATKVNLDESFFDLKKAAPIIKQLGLEDGDVLTWLWRAGDDKVFESRFNTLPEETRTMIRGEIEKYAPNHNVDYVGMGVLRSSHPTSGDVINDNFIRTKLKDTDGVIPDAVDAGVDGKTDTNIPDNIPDGAKPGVIPGYNAGVTERGVPYKYTIEDGKITSFEKITDPEGLADAISNLGGVYRIDPDMVEKIGEEHAYAINRFIIYYRDNMPTLPLVNNFKFLFSEDGAYAWTTKPFYTPKYNWRIEKGRVVADGYTINLAEQWFAKNRIDVLQEQNADDVRTGWTVRNGYDLAGTEVHEGGHSYMTKLATLSLNKRIADGEIVDLEAMLKKIDDDYTARELPMRYYFGNTGRALKELKTFEERKTWWIGKLVQDEEDALSRTIVESALKELGYDIPKDSQLFNEKWKGAALDISRYAGSEYFEVETFSEAQNDLFHNKANARQFSKAVVENMKKIGEKFGMAADPASVLKTNGLEVPKTLTNKDGSYKFPASAKTDAQKAKWLDKWRQKNPYMDGKGIMTEAEYQRANLWDTFFQKEIRSFDANAKSEMPETLVKRNGDFLDNLNKNAAKMLVSEIKKASIDGFSEKLASLALSKNSSDIADAMNDFIVQRVNRAAEQIASKMPGGLTEENLNQARVTLWSEQSVMNDFVDMVSTLIPDTSVKQIKEVIEKLFNDNAMGFAATDKLPVDLRELAAEEKKLKEKLLKENGYTVKKGRETDQALRDTYLGEATQVIHYRQGGEDVYAVVSDPVVASLLKKPNNYKETGVTVEAIAQMSNFIARTYRLGTTGVNPIALIRNVLRDPIQAIVTGGFNPLNMNLSPESFYRTLRQYGLDDDVINEVSQKIRGWAASSGLTAEMRDMGINGPAARGYRNKLEKATKTLNEKVLGNKIFEAGEAPLESWETMFRNQIGQQSFIKNYRKTGDVNKALSASLFDTSNATTNFSHSIGMFSRATATIPYLSSAINGTASFWRLFNMDPIGMTTRIVAGFMVPAMALTAWNLSDEERRKAYMNLPEWYRQSHIVLLDMENHVIALPIPEEIEQFYGTARKLIEFTQESSPYSIPQILTQGAFGFLPMDMDGFSGEDGSIDWGRGIAQLGSGILPQAFTTIYEFITEQDLYTGQDLSSYNGLNKAVYTLTNIFGTGFRQVINDIGMLCGASEKDLVGKSTANTLARDLFGLGFDEAKNQFMSLVGNPAQIDPQTGKETKATGLFAENEKLKKEIKTLDSQIAYSDESKKAELEELKAKKIQDFTDRVANLTNKYMQLYSITGGLEEWKKEKLVKLLTLSDAWTSADSDSYQAATTSEAYLNERALAQQRYINAGLPAGPSLESLPKGSIELQAAINRFYGAPKQATQDYKNAVESTGLKDIRNEFYDAINRIYDIAEANNESPDYDMIEKIQARYLQAVDAVLVPIINQYGIGILNNNDFIDAVRRQVNGMIPSDDWKQSTKNAKRFLSTKEFPTATVDVKKWLKQRYSGSIRNRNIDSDPEVVEQLQSIKADIDAGRRGAAQGKIQSLRNGISKANYYISATDLQTLTKYADMVK